MPLVFVDSRYRASGSGTAFTWELSESMLLRAARLKVEQLRVPVLFWTVDKNNCHVYVEEDGSTRRVLSLPQGNYSGCSLAHNLRALLGEAYTVTYDECQNSLEITSDTPFHIVPDKAIDNQWAFPAGASRLVPCSFNANLRHPSDTTSSEKRFFCPCVDLQTQPDLYLRCSALADPKVYGPLGSRDVLAKITMTVPYGFVAFEDSPNDLWHEVGSLSLRSVFFSLTDAAGVPVDLHGACISFTLLIQELNQ
jgi:hypothetical protein